MKSSSKLLTIAISTCEAHVTGTRTRVGIKNSVSAFWLRHCTFCKVKIISMVMHEQEVNWKETQRAAESSKVDYMKSTYPGASNIEDSVSNKERLASSLPQLHSGHQRIQFAALCGVYGNDCQCSDFPKLEDRQKNGNEGIFLLRWWILTVFPELSTSSLNRRAKEFIPFCSLALNAQR